MGGASRSGRKTTPSRRYWVVVPSGVMPWPSTGSGWAFNRLVGARLPGAQGPAAAASLSALLYVPVGIWVLASHPVTATAIGRAAVSAGRRAVARPGDAGAPDCSAVLAHEFELPHDIQLRQ